MLLRLIPGLALLALPASAAAAPTLAPLEPCYAAVSPDEGGTESVAVTGTGFTPNATVDVRVDGELKFTGVRIDEAGELSGSLAAPYVDAGRRAFTVQVTEPANPAQTVTAQALVTHLGVDVRPASARPSSRVRFKGSGFMGDGAVYAHYLRKGKARRTVRLTKRTTGACGNFSVRRRQFPFSPSTGRWIIQIDQHKRYRARPTSAFLRLRVDVELR